MARPGKKKRVLFILEIVVLLLFIGGLYVYGQITSRLDKVSQPKIEKEKILVNSEVPEMTGYTTYAVFGVDSRGEGSSLSANNSDTMIIVSINNDAKEVKLVSLYRDTFLNIGNGTYKKANAAYAYGGPEQAISMLNTNLDLNITDYATADFSALVEIIDAVGGLDIPLSWDEIAHVNSYCVETSEVTGKSYTPIERPETQPADTEAPIGTYHLNGVQATAYCRIRYTSSLDMGRTERQRTVISMIVEKAKKANITTLFKIVDAVFPMVETSISKAEILKLIPVLLTYDIGDKTGFPFEYKFSNVKGSIIVPTTLESNVAELHKLLYGDANYSPSSEVVNRSNEILNAVGGAANLEDAAATPSPDQTEPEDDFIWSNGGSTNNDYNNNYGDGSSGSTGGGDYGDGSGGSTGGGDYGDGSGGSTGNGDYGDGSGGSTGDGDYGDGSGGDYGDGSGGDYGDGSGGDYGDGSGGDYGDGSGGDTGGGELGDGTEGSFDDGAAVDGTGEAAVGYTEEI